MKKLVTLFSFIAVLGLLLSACGGGAAHCCYRAPAVANRSARSSNRGACCCHRSPGRRSSHPDLLGL